MMNRLSCITFYLQCIYFVLHPFLTMPQDTLVSFRLDPRVKSSVLRQTRRDDLSFSDVIRVLLKAYAKGEVKITVRAKQKKVLHRST